MKKGDRLAEYNDYHVGLVVAFVAIFAVIGLVMTLVPSDNSPRGFIDYFETVESCAGARLYTQNQVEGGSKYVDYKANTQDLHCYNYYTPIKRLEVGGSGQGTPGYGRCWQEKCCWEEPPLITVKHQSAPPEAFKDIKSRFRYSPVVEAQKGQALPETDLHKKIKEVCGVTITHQ